jgi:hypothetical protein
MSTYLLLRSNKQSGPYTLDQIRAIGLKAYDLVWIEGRSAAWRYPGEVEEFKSFAPVVEEQPYDRFYKRNPVKIQQPVLESKLQTGGNPSFTDQNRTFIYASPPAIEKTVAEKETIRVLDTALSSIPPGPEPVILDEKFSQPLDDIKKKYVQEVLNRKRDSLQFRQLATIAALVFGLILLFSGGIFVGLTINKRVINSTTKDLAKDEVGAGSQQADYHPHPIPVSASLGDQPPDKTATENDDYSQFLAEIEKKEARDRVREKTKAAAEKNPATSSVLKNNSGPDSGSLVAPVEERPTLHRTDAIVTRDAVKNNISEYVLLSSNKYYVGTFGGISDLEITVSNRSLYPMDLVVAELQYIQANKKIFKTENVFFRNIGPGSSLTQEAPKSSRGVKLQYRITVINSKELGLSYSGN